MMLAAPPRPGCAVAAVPCPGEPVALQAGFATGLWLTPGASATCRRLGAAHDDPALRWLTERVPGTRPSGIGPVRDRRIDHLTPSRKSDHADERTSRRCRALPAGSSY
jgi:hypothetical protein